jgi:adenosylcobinamide amidohydrolase
MTETTAGNWQKTIDLPTGCTVKVDETRSLVELPIPRIRGDCVENQKETENATINASSNVNGNGDKITSKRRWKAISSAIWKGGLRSFDSSESSSSNSGGDEKSKEGTDSNIDNEIVRVFNYKVPTTYDGLNPEPKAMLQNAIKNDYASAQTITKDNNNNDNDNDNDTSNTVGIMTAASMKSLRTASRSAGGIVVDVIVTAGISNARAAGAAADFFGILPTKPEATTCSQQSSDDDKKETPPPGTINTVVVINGATLTQEAMIEAYAIAIEAKCGACAEYSLACAKNARRLAQGTGTDCAVLLCPSLPPGVPWEEVSVAYAGKHCLLAELIGQAVKEATGEAILSNVHHLYGNGGTLPLIRYHWNRIFQSAKALILEGARPCVPEKPMDPVPRAPLSVLGLGGVLVALSYVLHTYTGFFRSATILVAAAAWDRCLPEPPLSVHPVVLAGTMISLATKQWIPETVFASHRPLLGFGAGVAFLVGTLGLFVSGAHVCLSILQWAEAAAAASGLVRFWQPMLAFGFWVLEVLLFKTTFSLQLLCTIALQMAGFLERSKLQEARGQLSWLCSRDPTHLNSEELAGGTLESLSVSNSQLLLWLLLLAACVQACA